MEYLFKELVQLIKCGNNEATEKLLLALKPLILSSIKKYARSDMDMEELLQEGYLELMRLTHDYDESKNIPYLGYVTKYLKYFFLNYLRGERIIYDSLNCEIRVRNETIELIDLLSDKRINVEEYCEAKEVSKLLFDAIRHISIRQQEVIYYYYFCNKPLKTIAKDMNVHYMSIVKLKKRAEKNLAGLLKSHKNTLF